VTQRELDAPPPPPPEPTSLDKARAAIVSCFGLGYAPIASGTFGTLGGVAVALLLAHAVVPATGVHFGVAAGVAVALLVVLGVALGGWSERHYRLKDPGPFVLDEVAGYLVALLRLKDGVPGTRELLLAFLAFRFFDVVKPWPARRMEHLPRGFGIMLDDVVAGFYALAVVALVRVWKEWP
jgi:phosphatidylglycerophosphatase A